MLYYPKVKGHSLSKSFQFEVDYFIDDMDKPLAVWYTSRAIGILFDKTDNFRRCDFQEELFTLDEGSIVHTLMIISDR